VVHLRKGAEAGAGSKIKIMIKSKIMIMCTTDWGSGKAGVKIRDYDDD
jgi:hypothetical protein